MKPPELIFADVNEEVVSAVTTPTCGVTARVAETRAGVTILFERGRTCGSSSAITR